MKGNKVYFRKKENENKHLSLEQEQIENMIHMSGVKQTKRKARGYYHSYRNYFWAGDHDNTLEDLVEKGICIFRDIANGSRVNRVYYLSHKGYEVLSSFLGNIMVDKELIYSKNGGESA